MDGTIRPPDWLASAEARRGLSLDLPVRLVEVEVEVQRKKRPRGLDAGLEYWPFACARVGRSGRAFPGRIRACLLGAKLGRGAKTWLGRKLDS